MKTLLLFTLFSCASPTDAPTHDGLRAGFPALPAPATGQERATFAGGCFWCMETAFEGKKGVLSVTSGYTGGHKKMPTYREVSQRTTGHAEAVDVIFDPEQISYEKLLDIYWHNIDPTTADRQFCDVGDEYRPEIFVHDDKQKAAAIKSRDDLIKKKKFAAPVVVKISAATKFYPAETYHQDFWKKSPTRYYSYRRGCGRDRRLQELWGEVPGQASH